VSGDQIRGRTLSSNIWSRVACLVLFAASFTFLACDSGDRRSLAELETAVLTEAEIEAAAPVFRGVRTEANAAPLLADPPRRLAEPPDRQGESWLGGYERFFAPSSLRSVQVQLHLFASSRDAERAVQAFGEAPELAGVPTPFQREEVEAPPGAVLVTSRGGDAVFAHAGAVVVIVRILGPTPRDAVPIISAQLARLDGSR
jgi:hypothetical protein